MFVLNCPHCGSYISQGSHGGCTWLYFLDLGNGVLVRASFAVRLSSSLPTGELDSSLLHQMARSATSQRIRHYIISLCFARISRVFQLRMRRRVNSSNFDLCMWMGRARWELKPDLFTIRHWVF